VSFAPATHDPATCDGRRLNPAPGTYTRTGDDDVTMIRVESILAIAILLALLLQLPRLDDPPALRLVGGEITRVEGIKGAALYVDTGTSGIVLVYVSELLMHQAPSGTAYVTKLDGTVLGQGLEHERLHIDTTGRAAALGWRPVTHLDGLMLPGNDRDRHAYEFRRLRLRKVIHKGRDVLLIVGRVEAIDLVTGQIVSEDYDEEATCPAIPFLECVRVAGASDTRESIEPRPMVASRRSSGGEDCFLAFTGTMCWPHGREPPSRRSLAWTAGYRYN
jgi:hypothetical protein